jgi:two-component system sensor histidine kinase HydH
MVTAAAEPSDLIAVLRVYNDVTEKLKHSHEALAGEVHRLRGELNEKNRELQRREHLAALGQMAAGVAHEIRNPLGGIGIYASVLQKELVDRPEQREIARRISAGVQNLENIVRDILVFAGNGTQRSEPICLGALMEGVASHVERQVGEFGTDFQIDGGLEGVLVRGDAGRIERALLNLSFNAIEAAGRGGTVWVRCGKGDDGMVAIFVEDNGPGIDPAVLNKIFNPFFTTKDDGTGLGLAIVHSIAESHGGFVRAGNRPGGGASFVLTLPAEKHR